MKKEKIIKFILVLLIILTIIGIFIYKNINKIDISQKNNLDKKVDIYYNENNLPKLLDFGSTTCEPCLTMIPILDKIGESYKGKLEVKFINVYTDFNLAKDYNIKVIPTQIFLDVNGKVMYRHEGILYEDKIIEKLNGMGVK